MILQEYLDDGVYGKVYKAQTADNKTVAVKYIKKITIFQREYIFLKLLSNSTFVDIDINEKFLVLELAQPLEFYKGTVSNLISSLKFGLIYIHSLHCLHMDIKIKNIMVFNNIPKFIDFGLVRLQNLYSDFPKNIYPPPYKSIEILLAESSKPYQKIPVSPAVDIWALGCVFYSLLTGKRFSSLSKMDVISRQNQIYTQYQTIPQQIKDYFSFDPLDRIQKFNFPQTTLPFPSIIDEIWNVQISLDILTSFIQIVSDLSCCRQTIIQSIWLLNSKTICLNLLLASALICSSIYDDIPFTIHSLKNPSQNITEIRNELLIEFGSSVITNNLANLIPTLEIKEYYKKINLVGTVGQIFNL